MQNLFPIIRRKRRPLVVSEPQKPSIEESERTETTDGTHELVAACEDAAPVVTKQEKETDAPVSTEDEAQ